MTSLLSLSCISAGHICALGMARPRQVYHVTGCACALHFWLCASTVMARPAHLALLCSATVPTPHPAVTTVLVPAGPLCLGVLSRGTLRHAQAMPRSIIGFNKCHSINNASKSGKLCKTSNSADCFLLQMALSNTRLFLAKSHDRTNLDTYEWTIHWRFLENCIQK